jgi:methylmalonyl-CoA mutase N-terminal domain/subunit
MGATDPKAMMLRFHTQTGGSTLTAQQPENNIVRVTIQAMAAVIGGTQSLHTNGYDEALNLPTEKAAGLALRTQQIIANESGIAYTDDPLGGSFFIEELTNTMENEANTIIQHIENIGGAVAAIEQGYMQEQIANSAYKYQTDIESQSKIIVGVNKFTENENTPPPSFKIDDSIRTAQIQKIEALKQKRDNAAVTQALQKIKNAAQGNDNLMPYILDAVEKYATLGEISDTLREVFGEYNG